MWNFQFSYRRASSGYLIRRIVALSDQSWHKAVRVARPKAWTLHFRTYEVVPLHASVTETQRRNNKVEELKDL
jgi:hypothetical protein